MAENDVYELALHQVIVGQQCVNRWHVRFKNAAAVIDDLADVANFIKNQVRQRQHPSVEYVRWTARQLRGSGVNYVAADCRPTGGLQAEGSFSSPTVGAMGTTEMLPPQDAIVISLRTGHAGRRRRGRQYVSGYAEGSQSGGTWVPGEVTASQAVFQAIMDAYSATGTDTEFELGIWSVRIATGCRPGAAHPHPIENVDTPAPNDAYRAITTFQVSATVATQRRRRIGVGV